MVLQQPAAGYKTNTFQEIRSHSSVLFNERMAILFYRLDNEMVDLHSSYDINVLMRTRAILLQIYSNIRMLISNNPTMRVSLNLETQAEGVYITDIIFDTIEKMIQYCQVYGWSQRKIYLISMELSKLDMLVKKVLQYFHYFIRPDFRQKPDIEMATERYKEIADMKTVEELRAIVGERNKIDFDNLGSDRIEYATNLDELDETNSPGDLSILDEDGVEKDDDLKSD